MPKHSPAPWTSRNHSDKFGSHGTRIVSRIKDVEFEIAHVYSRPSEKANVRLILQSPALLDSLKDLVAAIKKARTIRAPAGHYDEDVYYNGIDFAGQVDIAEEIIALAEGTQEA